MPIVIAHRGASGAHPPGNTLVAFRAAGPLGASWVELDVRRTADAALIVHHDPHLPDGRALVTLTTEQLPDWVPTLEEALDACAGLSVNVEIKNATTEPDFDPTEVTAEAVVALVSQRAARGEGQEILISSFRPETVAAVRATDGAPPTALLVLDPAPEALEAAADADHRAIHPWYGLVGEATVARARELGLAVNVWTVDDPDQMMRLVDLGVDGLVTNVPDVAARVLASASGRAASRGGSDVVPGDGG